MERIDIILKGIIGFMGGMTSYLAGGLGWFFAILLILMLADFITGLMISIVQKEVSSAIGIKGLFKKVYVIILIGVIYLVEQQLLGSNGAIGDGTAIAFIVIELVSITENGGKLGVPMPEQIKNVIKLLKNENIENSRR